MTPRLKDRVGVSSDVTLMWPELMVKFEDV
jgi:hypothetical protein